MRAPVFLLRMDEAYAPRSCLAEVALQQAGERLAVTSLIAGHLMHGVVDGIEAGGLGALGEVELAGGGAVLGLNAHLEVLLGGVGDDLAEELGELGGVLGLLPGGLLDRKSVV